MLLTILVWSCLSLSRQILFHRIFAGFVSWQIWNLFVKSLISNWDSKLDKGILYRGLNNSLLDKPLQMTSLTYIRSERVILSFRSQQISSEVRSKIYSICSLWFPNAASMFLRKLSEDHRISLSMMWERGRAPRWVLDIKKVKLE